MLAENEHIVGVNIELDDFIPVSLQFIIFTDFEEEAEMENILPTLNIIFPKEPLNNLVDDGVEIISCRSSVFHSLVRQRTGSFG